MRFRKLRIAWSVAWGVVAVLLCVLWVRSYFRSDRMLWRLDNFVEVNSSYGKIELERGENPFGGDGAWKVTTKDAESDDLSKQPFVWNQRGLFAHTYRVTLPYWLAVLIGTVLVVVPWLRMRFSLRTLLIATTLIAVVLGMIELFLR